MDVKKVIFFFILNYNLAETWYTANYLTILSMYNVYVNCGRF